MSESIAPIERPEFVGRVRRLQDVMRQRSVDLMVLDDIEILAYYTGYERSISFYRACLVPAQGDPVMVLRSLDTAPFIEASWVADPIGYQDTDDAVGAIAAVVRDRGYARAAIGLDEGSHGMTVDVFKRLGAALPQARFIAMTGVPWEQRLIKSPAEIAHIARAAAIADQTMLEITQRARPGLSGRDITAFAAGRYVELGASPGHVGPITYGRGWGFLHGHLHDTPLAPGDVLHLELVPRFRGYSGRLMRSVVMGRPTAEQAHTADRLIALQDRQIDAMVPGARADRVDAILRDALVQEGLRDSYDNITGYTLGYYSQQPIRSSDFTRVFNRGSDWTLQAGMVFHMYTSARGLAFSESVLVGPDGPRRLTQLPRQLYWSEL